MAKTNDAAKAQREELIRLIKGITGLELKRCATATAGLSVSNKDMRANMFAHLLCNQGNFQTVAWMLENWKTFQSGEFIPEEYQTIADPVSVGYACGTSPRFVLAFNANKKSKVDRHQSKDAAKTGRPQEFIAWAQSWRMAVTQSLWVGTSRSVKTGVAATTKAKISNEEPWAAYDAMLAQMLEFKVTNEDWLIHFQPKRLKVVVPQMDYSEKTPNQDTWCADYCDTMEELLERPIMEEIQVDVTVQTAIDSQKRLAGLLAEGGLTVAKTLSSTKDFAAAANAALERLLAKKAADAAKAEVKPEVVKPIIQMGKPKTGKSGKAAKAA